MTHLHCTALTLFPEMFANIHHEGVVARALRDKKISLETIFLRDFSNNHRKDVDHHPAGGSDGMVICADIAERALLSVKTQKSYIIHLTPSGKLFNNLMAKELAQKSHLIFLCGRYAGFDHRFVEREAHCHISIGDFVLSGGELPALCLIDSIARFIPGVLSNELSSATDSLEDGFLEAPQYTKPNDYHGMTIPSVLLSGDHKKILAYQRKEKIKWTAQMRPDLILLQWDNLNRTEKIMVEKIWKHIK